MNTPLDHTTPDDGSEDLRYAEYVLGVLDADARAAVEREIAADPRAAAEVARWQQHLLPLAEDVAPARPPDYVWTRIQSELGAGKTPQRTPTPAAARSGWWNSLSLWRGFAFGAAAIAAACIVALIVLPRTPATAPSATQAHYLVARIEQDNGLPGWTVTVNRSSGNLVIVPATPAPVAANRSPELWLIPQGGKPIAIGVFDPQRATTLALHSNSLAQLDTHALLAVSIEPQGGSPTGQPTGPVVGKGPLGGI